MKGRVDKRSASTKNADKVDLNTRNRQNQKLDKYPAGHAMTQSSDSIIFTDSAASRVSDLIAEEGNPDLMLRVYVQGGGCSGFQYGFTFDESVNEDDTEIQKNGVKVLIDAMSIQYLAGAEIDYKEDISGSQFVIRNPNATTTCGCGSSFTV
jgi:iron-sulfur cluster insertion protein